MEASALSVSTSVIPEQENLETRDSSQKDQILKKKLSAIVALKLSKKDTDKEIVHPASNWTVSNLIGKSIVFLLPWGSMAVALATLAHDISDVIVIQLEDNCIVPWWSLGIGVGLVLLTGAWTITDLFYQRVESKNTKIAQEAYLKNVEEARFNQYLESFLSYRKKKNKNYKEVLDLLNNCSEKYRNALIPYEMWISLIRYVSEKGALKNNKGNEESESTEEIQRWDSFSDLLKDAYEYAHPSSKVPEITFNKPAAPFNGEQAEQPVEFDLYDESYQNDDYGLTLQNGEEEEEKQSKFSMIWSEIEAEVGHDLRYVVYNGKFLGCNGKIYTSHKHAAKAKKLQNDECVIDIKD